MIHSTPPLVFFICIGVAVAVIIAYAIMELARPWPEKRRAKEEAKTQQEREKRHALQDNILNQAQQQDNIIKEEHQNLKTAQEIVHDVDTKLDSGLLPENDTVSVTNNSHEPNPSNTLPTTHELFTTLPQEQTVQSQTGFQNLYPGRKEEDF